MEHGKEREGRDQKEKDFFEQMIKLNRVSKVQKGGRRFSYSVLVVVGDRNGRAGFGLGKANDSSDAIRKAVDIARRSMFEIPIKNGTLIHPIYFKYKASKMILKPASPGTGIIAGGHIRAVMEAIGIKDVLAKRLGSGNSLNIIKGLFEAFSQSLDGRKVAKSRGRTLKDIWGGAQ